MRSLALFLLAICFVSVSALAGYEKANADNLVSGKVVSELSTQQIASEVSASVADQETGDEADTRKVDCPCKQKSGSPTLSCGVTLALSGDNPGGYLAGMKQAWFANAQTDRNARLMYLLKRPPRTIL